MVNNYSSRYTLNFSQHISFCGAETGSREFNSVFVYIFVLSNKRLSWKRYECWMWEITLYGNQFIM